MPVILKRLMRFCKKRLRVELIRSFLLHAQKKRTKEKGSLKSFLSLTFFRLPTHYNSSSFVLLKQ